jgi:hypothetical protein
MGCLIYDLVVAAYLAWRTWRGDLRTAGGEKSTAWPTAVKRVGLSLWVGLVVLVQVGLVWWADESGWLPWTTIGIALIVVAGMAWLRPIPQSLGWVVLTGWMAMTFAHGGQLVEILVFVALLAIAVLGYTSSPWWLVAAWGFHAAWSLLPRDIHHHGGAMGHLGAWPLASALFDVVITAYLVFAVLRGRLHRPVFTPRVPVAAD